jgi:hypothetical protein
VKDSIHPHIRQYAAYHPKMLAHHFGRNLQEVREGTALQEYAEVALPVKDLNYMEYKWSSVEKGMVMVPPVDYEAEKYDAVHMYSMIVDQDKSM